jgi:hypothetical protein
LLLLPLLQATKTIKASNCRANRPITYPSPV